MDKSKQWVAVALAAALVLVAGGWFLLVQPKRVEAAQLGEQAELQRVQNAQLATQLEVLRAKAAGLPEQQADLAELAERIPSEPELPDLVRALTAAGRASGVTLAAITPAAPTAVTPAGATADEATDEAAALSAVPVSMRVTGDFYELEQFIAALEDLPRALRVTGLSVTDADDTGGRVLTGTVAASVYVAGAAGSTTGEPAAEADAPAGSSTGTPAATGTPPATGTPAATPAEPVAVPGPPAGQEER